MRTSSNRQPEPFKTITTDKTWVLLRENITSEIVQTEEGDEVVWTYDEYAIKTAKRSNLQETVEENFAEWLNLAKFKEIETLGNHARQRRNALLSETDHFFLRDRIPPLGMEEYRQALRDIPDQEGFPYEIEWPEYPKN